MYPVALVTLESQISPKGFSLLKKKVGSTVTTLSPQIPYFVLMRNSVGVILSARAVKPSHLTPLASYHLPFPPATPTANRLFISAIFRFTGSSTWRLSARSMDSCGLSFGYGKKSWLRQTHKVNVKMYCTSKGTLALPV